MVSDFITSYVIPCFYLYLYIILFIFIVCYSYNEVDQTERVFKPGLRENNSNKKHQKEKLTNYLKCFLKNIPCLI